MKKVLSETAIAAVLCLAGSVVCSQDVASSQKTYKAKCAGCHGHNAEGKPAMKAPAIKGKSAEEIQKQISTSPKHAAAKKLTADEVKELAAYLGTLK